MRFEDFDAFCLSLPAASVVVQWGGAHVYKFGGKVFAIAGLNADDDLDKGYVFKTSEISFEVLTESGLARRAPYLPRGGWLALRSPDVLAEAELKAYITQSHSLVAAGLSKSERRRLGLPT